MKKKEGRRMLSRVAPLRREYRGPKALKRRSATLTCLRVASTGMARGRTRFTYAVLVLRRRRGKQRRGKNPLRHHVTGQGMVVDDDTTLEGMCFSPSAVGKPLRVKHMWDKMCNGKGFKFFE